MKFSLDEGDSRFIIRSYEQGCIVVNEESFTRSFVITQQELIRDWSPQSFDDLEPDHLHQLTETKPEIVILGTGNQIQFPEPALQAIIMGCGIGLEIMDTAAACRTYNILSAEGRSVTAALIML